MFALLICALVFYLVGGYLGLPRSMRFTLLGLFYVAILGVHLIFPDDHPLRLATGESAAPWAILGGFIVLILAYRYVLSWLKRRAEPQTTGEAELTPDAFKSEELDRYARHIVLREIGGPGQMALKKARVLVIGAGGLGAPALQYLASSGVGIIGIIDHDVVENANLQRQVIHQDAAIGTPKVFSAQAQLEAQNPHIKILPYNRRFEADIAETLCAEYDIILDGSDNFDTRYLANKTAIALNKPLVFGALSPWEGQVSVFDPATSGPCYQCIFPAKPSADLAPTCSEAGVFAPLPGIIGTMMAGEALKLLTRAGSVLRGEMIIYDALYSEMRKIKTSPRADCPICGAGQRLNEKELS